MNQESLENINRKLDLICHLLVARYFAEQKLSDPDQILKLSQFDLAPSEIARILSKTPNAVHIALSRLRKRGMVGKEKAGNARARRTGLERQVG